MITMAWYDQSIDFKNPKRPGFHKRIILDADKLKQLYYQGQLIENIASYFNCSIQTIRRHLKFLIPKNLQRYKFNYSQSNPVNQRIIKLYTNHHHSTEKIAEIIELSGKTVRKRLHRLGIELRGRGFKNLETFHPKQFNRRNKQYTIDDLATFNQKFIEYYCLGYPKKKIAELLQIDKRTVSKRINYFRFQYNFKSRFCKRCENIFRFIATKYQRNARICTKCRKNAS